MFSSTSQSSFLRSRIDADTRATVDAVPGVAESGGIGLVQLGARVPGNGPRDLAATALFGYELAPVGVPDAAGSRRGLRRRRAARRRRRGGHGDPPRARPLAGDRDRVRVRHDLLGAGIAVGRPGDVARGAVGQPPRRSSSATTSSRPSSCARADDADVADVAAAIDDATGGATESLTITEAVDAIPGVEQQRSTFNQIIGVTIAIAVVVVALFFALLTVERLGLYGVLKAIGARSRTLFAGLVAAGGRRDRRRRRRRRVSWLCSSTP